VRSVLKTGGFQKRFLRRRASEERKSELQGTPPFCERVRKDVNGKGLAGIGEDGG
jgi:hypothetical protein